MSKEIGSKVKKIVADHLGVEEKKLLMRLASLMT